MTSLITATADQGITNTLNQIENYFLTILRVFQQSYKFCINKNNLHSNISKHHLQYIPKKLNYHHGYHAFLPRETVSRSLLCFRTPRHIDLGISSERRESKMILTVMSSFNKITWSSKSGYVWWVNNFVWNNSRMLLRLLTSSLRKCEISTTQS